MYVCLYVSMYVFRYVCVCVCMYMYIYTYIQACAKIIQETNAVFIPPFDDLAIIAGQASCAKELIETHADLDYLLTPVGGGGLAAGTPPLSSKVLLTAPSRARNGD